MPPTDEPAWTITQQQETSDLGPANTYVSGVRITFRTALGVVGSVFVAATDYTPAKVRQLVGDKAAAVDAVQGMTG